MTGLSIEDTWHMTGMRGTGSDTVVAYGVFVPGDHVISFAGAVAGAYRRADEPLSRIAFPQGIMLPFASALLGMGMAMYDHVVAELRNGKPLVSGAALHPTAIEAPGVQAGTTLDAGGASSFAQPGPVERIWRDLGTASRHPAFRVEIDGEQYARLLLSPDRPER